MAGAPPAGGHVGPAWATAGPAWATQGVGGGNTPVLGGTAPTTAPFAGRGARAAFPGHSVPSLHAPLHGTARAAPAAAAPRGAGAPAASGSAGQHATQPHSMGGGADGPASGAFVPHAGSDHASGGTRLRGSTVREQSRGSDIEELYPRAERLGHEIDVQLEALESGSDRSDTMRNAVARNINRLSQDVAQLEAAAARIVGAKRGLWRSRVRVLTDKASSLRSSLERFLGGEFRRSQEQKAREDLFAGGSGAAIHMEASMKEHDSLLRSNRMMDELIEHQGTLLSSLRSQGETLKAARRKVLDMATSLGLSTSIIRVIQRRTTADRILVYTGMVLILLLMWWLFSSSSGGDPHEGNSIAPTEE